MEALGSPVLTAKFSAQREESAGLEDLLRTPMTPWCKLHGASIFFVLAHHLGCHPTCSPAPCLLAIAKTGKPWKLQSPTDSKRLGLGLGPYQLQKTPNATWPVFLHVCLCTIALHTLAARCSCRPCACGTCMGLWHHAQVKPSHHAHMFCCQLM